MFDGKSVADFLTENVVVVLVVAVAVAVLTQAFAGQIRKTALAVFITLIAFFLIGLSTHSGDVGGWLYRLFTGGN